MTGPLSLPSALLLSVQQSEEAWRQAVLSGEADVLEYLLDDEYVFVDPMGSVTRKHSDLSVHRRGIFHMNQFDVADRDIHEFDSVATVCFSAHAVGTFHGAPFAGTFRYLRVWRRANGAWRLISSSATELPAPLEP
jgi:ketosteroid isomerase-like protein